MPKPRRTNQQGKKNNRGSLRQELLQLQVTAKAGLVKGTRGTGRADSQASDDDEVASEVLSHYSSTSETASVAEEGTVNETVDEQSLQEEGEDKLRECIDNVTDKSSKTRQTALESLRLTLSSRILYDVLVDRRLTLTDALERCLKKGKGEEQSLAAGVFTLLCLQMGSGPEGEEVFRSLKPLLISILTDTSASPIARQSCASALAMCCYLVAADVEDLSTCLACLEGIFSSSYISAASPITVQHNPQLQLLYCSALHAWALLLTICPNSQVERSLLNHLPKLPGLLSSENVNLRIVAGETIALLFELARELEDDFYYEETDLLCAKLKALATDSNKYRAKLDRRKQRSIFRDVLHFIENGECHEETIKFGLECMYVDSWVRRRTYTAFKEVLGSGVRHHLQNNELLRDVLELGPPIVMDAAAIKASKITRVEKHMYNSAAFKARTKVRSKLRDKRADIM